MSNAGIPNRDTYRDFGLVTTLPGPGTDNHVMVIAGTRDAGLMYIAEALASESTTRQLSQGMGNDYNNTAQGYEALFRVNGADRTSLDAELVHDAHLDTSRTWSKQN